MTSRAIAAFRLQFVVALALAVLLIGSSRASAQVAPSLGAAQSFAVLGGSTVTNTGSTVVTGDLGLSPGTAVTGFPPGVVVSGSIYAAGAVAQNAQNAATTAYNSLVAQGCTLDLTGQDLGNRTLTSGVYCYSAAAQMTGTLTLNGQGNSNSVFIIKIGSALTTASGATMVLINGASACNVFFQITTSATLGTSTRLEGTLIALTSITLTTGARINGRAIARNGAVTLDTNTVSATCVVASVCPVISQLPATMPLGTVGTLYSQAIAASGGGAPYTFSITAGALPAGMALSAAGVVSGTPTTAGTTSATIRSTDANGCFTSVVYTFVISAAPIVCPTITIAPATLPNGVVGTLYSQTLIASGGTAPYAFAVVAGALPPGLSLASTGIVSGTPTTAGSSSVTIRALDANGCQTTAVSVVVVTAAICPVITLTPTPLPNAVIGVAYSQTLTAAGGTAPYVFAVVAGALPAGLSLAPGGVLSGTPTAAGSSSVTIRALDNNSCQTTAASVMVVNAAVCPVITLTPATTPNAVVGTAYSQALTASGGTGPYVFTVTAGALPAGLTLSAAGVVSGTPTTSGTSGFTVRATDSNGCFAEIAFTIIATTPVPALPAALIALLAMTLLGAGYMELRRRVRA